jgi:hypothetical protein
LFLPSLPETPYPLAGEGRGIEMKSLDIPIVITPTLTLPRQRGRGIPGFPDGNYLDLDFIF